MVRTGKGVDKIPPSLLIIVAVLGGGGAGMSLHGDDDSRLARVEVRLDHLIEKVESGILPEADRRITALEWKIGRIENMLRDQLEF